MEAKTPAKKRIKLTWKKGWVIFAVSWVVTLAAVYVLRQVLIPRDEMNCYNRVCTLQKAVNHWDKAHPDKLIRDEIDENAFVQAGFLKPLAYDHEKHYYFVGETAHGWKVKCNKHEDNPLVLRLTGVTLLAVLVFVVFCSFRRYVLFD
jgi:hypothetical protein